MAVELSDNRNWKGIKWDASFSADERVDLRATNPDGDDVSTKPNIKNDGENVVSFDPDYNGTAHITITDSVGNVEEGDITV